MPLDRADAVVIGAGAEGLTAALSLALAGRKVVCVDRRDRVETLGRPVEAWIAPDLARRLGLFPRGLVLRNPRPHLSFHKGQWLGLWPDIERTVRSLSQPQADAFRETVATLRRLRTILQEPNGSARAMMTCLDLVVTSEPDISECGAFLRASATGYLSQRLGSGALSATLLAIAARQAPVDPDAEGSAPMLLSLAILFDDAFDAPRPVAGDQAALINVLARAFRETGGDLLLGQTVSEIQMEREAVAAVTIDGRDVKTPLAIAALSPRRLAQGLLSTRRYGRLLSQLRSAPRRSQSLMALTLDNPPDLPDARLSLWGDGLSVWLGARMETFREMVASFQGQRIPQSPVIEVRLSPGLRAAMVAAPYCPSELDGGPWTESWRERLKGALLGVIQAEWPECFSAIEEARLITPRVPEAPSATGAIFATRERMPDFDVIFALSGDQPAPLLKGLYLCDPMGSEPDGFAGAFVAAAAGRATAPRARI